MAPRKNYRRVQVLEPIVEGNEKPLQSLEAIKAVRRPSCFAGLWLNLTCQTLTERLEMLVIAAENAYNPDDPRWTDAMILRRQLDECRVASMDRSSADKALINANRQIKVRAQAKPVQWR